MVLEELGINPDDVTVDDFRYNNNRLRSFLHEYPFSFLSEYLYRTIFFLSISSSLRYICEVVSRRASFMASAGITALLKKMDYKDVVIAIDGSLFR